MGKTNSTEIQHLRIEFPNIRKAKIKEGVFVGPEIKQVFRDPDLEDTFSELEHCLEFL